jgi:heme-degrading monooxygenase HmoA
MIKQIWRSYATPGNAHAYEHLLRVLLLPAYESLRFPGYGGAELLRREGDDEVEFILVITIDSKEAFQAFRTEMSGPVSVPYAAQKLLIRWDETPSFYEVRQVRPGGLPALAS